jgi:hypothetical protein
MFLQHNFAQKLQIFAQFCLSSSRKYKLNPGQGEAGKLVLPQFCRKYFSKNWTLMFLSDVPHH